MNEGFGPGLLTSENSRKPSELLPYQSPLTRGTDRYSEVVLWLAPGCPRRATPEPGSPCWVGVGFPREPQARLGHGVTGLRPWSCCGLRALVFDFTHVPRSFDAPPADSSQRKRRKS